MVWRYPIHLCCLDVWRTEYPRLLFCLCRVRSKKEGVEQPLLLHCKQVSLQHRTWPTNDNNITTANRYFKWVTKLFDKICMYEYIYSSKQTLIITLDVYDEHSLTYQSSTQSSNVLWRQFVSSFWIVLYIVLVCFVSVFIELYASENSNKH